MSWHCDGGPGGERGPSGHWYRGGSNQSVNNNSRHLTQEDSLGTNYTGFAAAGGELEYNSKTILGSHEVKQIIKIKTQLSLHYTDTALHWLHCTALSGQVIVFVALLVGGGFVTMVWIELALGWVWDKLSDSLGRQKVKDPENPAALVGSFKRYKWGLAAGGERWKWSVQYFSSIICK